MTEHAGNSSDSRFVRIENRLSELGENMAQLLMWKEGVNNDLYNHGGPTGMKTILTNFVADYYAREEEREKAALAREKESERYAKSKRFKITIVSSGVFLIVATILGWLLSMVIPAAKAILDDYYQRHPAAQVQHSFSQNPDPVVSYERKQDAEIPLLRR